ncbi:MAG: MFS transporter [bacterium]
MLFLPWALKFALGPVVGLDGRGRRKAWIVPLQLAGVGALLVLAQLSLRLDFALVMALVAGISVISASQDVATDALAVEVLRPEERGAGNAVQVGAYRIGMVVSGGVLLMLYGRLAWEGAFLVMAGGLALATLPILLYREPPREATAPEAVPFLAAFRGYLARPGAGAWLVVLLLYKTFDALPGRMVGPMLIARGYDIEAIGTVLGTLGSVAALVGAVLAAVWMRHLDRVRALVLFGALQLVAVSLYLLPAADVGGLEALYVAVAADELFGTIATVALFATMMDACRPGWAATDYTVQASLVVVATGASAAAGGFVAARLGFAGLFALTSALTLAGWIGARALLHRGVLRRLEATPEALAPPPTSV